MLRLLITAIISFLISFGAISKSQKVSSLLNHVTQDHGAHTHDHHGEHHHKHSHKKTKKTDNDHKEHSHHFDFSLLVHVLSFEKDQNGKIVIPPFITKLLVPINNSSLLLSSYSFSIFRPPIV